MIKAIIFDCFGVLTTDTWRELIGSLPPGDAVTKAKQLNHQFDAGQLEFDVFIKQVSQLTGADKQTLIKIFTDPESNKNEPLLKYIRSLKPRYKIGILSNVNRDWIREVFLTPEEQELFDSFILSYEVGATKPDPKMYQAALKDLEVQPEEAVFIDDVERYCTAAEEQGIKAILYKDFSQMKRELGAILTTSPDN